MPNFEDSDFRVEEEYGIQSPDSLVKDCHVYTIQTETRKMSERARRS